MNKFYDLIGGTLSILFAALLSTWIGGDPLLNAGIFGYLALLFFSIYAYGYQYHEMVINYISNIRK